MNKKQQRQQFFACTKTSKKLLRGWKSFILRFGAFFFAQNFFVKKKNELAWNCPNNLIYNTTAQNLLLASIFHAFIGPCGHLRDLLRYKNDHWFLSVTLNWICNYKCQTKVFWVAKWYLVVIIKLPYSRNTTAFSALVAQG